MKKLLSVFTVFVGIFLFSGLSNQAYAIDSCSELFGSSFNISNFNPNYGPEFVAGKTGTVSSMISGLTPGANYTIKCERNGFAWSWPSYDTFSIATNGTGAAALNLNNGNCWSDAGDYRLKIITSTGLECVGLEYESLEEEKAVYCVESSVNDVNGLNGCFEDGETIEWRFKLVGGDGNPYQQPILVRSRTAGGGVLPPITPNADGVVSGTAVAVGAGSDMYFRLYANDASNPIDSCTVIGPQIAVDICTDDMRENGSRPVGPEEFSLCKQIPEDQTEQRKLCMECTGGELGEEGDEGVWTAIGCIKRDPQSILQRFITVGLGMAGGVALITFLAAGFIFSTSQGDPKAYGKAKEMMTSSLIGLLFIIFSVTLLQFIGYEILKIPGFGG